MQLLDSLTIQAIAFAEAVNDTINMARLYNLRGNLFGFLHKTEKMIDSYNNTLKLARAMKSKEMEYMALSGLGSYYFQAKQYQKANELRKQNLAVAKEIGDPMKIAIEQSKYAYGLTHTGNLVEAKSELKKAHDLFTQLNFSSALIISKGELGEVYFRLNNIDSAYYFLNEAYALLEKGIKEKYKADVLFWLAKVYLAKNDNLKALSLTNEGIKYSDQFGNAYLKMKFYKLKAEVLAHMNKADEVFKNYSIYEAMKDSLNSKESEKLRVELQEKFEANEREYQINLLKKEQQVAKLKQQGLMIGFTFFIIVLALISWNLKRKNNQRKLAHQLALAEKQKLQERVEYQNRELTSKALQIIQKNEYANLVQDQLEELGKKEQLNDKQLKALKSSTLQLQKTDKDWEYFNTFFTEVNPTFYSQLSNLQTDLTSQELRQAALVKMNLSPKEAASILNIAPQSVKMARNRLKKKLNLSPEEDLGSYLRQIS